MQETWVRSLSQEDPLEKEIATHSSTLAWKIPWTEKAGRLQSIGSQSRTRLSDCLPALLHVRKYMTLTRFLLYPAMLGNAILLFFFLHQNQNYVERVKKTPSVTTEIRITFFFLFSKTHQCYIMKGKTISPRLSLTVPNKYANFVGLVRKP